jgi:hypothetical protein
MTTSMLFATKQLNDNTVSPGVLGFVVVVALCIAVYFLLRSFRKHIERVPRTFDPPVPESSGPAVTPAGPGTPASPGTPPTPAGPATPAAPPKPPTAATETDHRPGPANGGSAIR